jgi:ATP-dependent Lon protease
VLGAHRAGITTVVLPKDNEADLEDIPEEVRKQLEFHFVRTLDELFELALVPESRPLGPVRKEIMEEEEEAAAAASAGARR